MNRTQVDIAAGGMQQDITMNDGSVLKTATLAATTLIDIDMRGLRRAQLHVRASAVTGIVTPSAYTTYKDGATQKTVSTPAGGALVAGVRQTLAFAEGDLLGEQIVRLAFTVAGGASATMDQAEINGI